MRFMALKMVNNLNQKIKYYYKIDLTPFCSFSFPFSLTEPAQRLLDQKETTYPQKINRAVSFNAIKDQALGLLFLSDLESEALLDRLTLLFQKNPCLERKHRNPPRKNSSSRSLLDFQKRKRKHCY